jgi:hypothetical protein
VDDLAAVEALAALQQGLHSAVEELAALQQGLQSAVDDRAAVAESAARLAEVLRALQELVTEHWAPLRPEGRQWAVEELAALQQGLQSAVDDRAAERAARLAAVLHDLAFLVADLLRALEELVTEHWAPRHRTAAEELAALRPRLQSAVEKSTALCISMPDSDASQRRVEAAEGDRWPAPTQRIAALRAALPRETWHCLSSRLQALVRDIRGAWKRYKRVRADAEDIRWKFRPASLEQAQRYLDAPWLQTPALTHYLLDTLLEAELERWTVPPPSSRTLLEWAVGLGLLSLLGWAVVRGLPFALRPILLLLDLPWLASLLGRPSLAPLLDDLPWLAGVVLAPAVWYYVVYSVGFVWSAWRARGLARIHDEVASGLFDSQTVARRLHHLEDRGLDVSSLIYALLRLEAGVAERAPGGQPAGADHHADAWSAEPC